MIPVLQPNQDEVLKLILLRFKTNMDVPEEGKAVAESIDNKAKELWSQATSSSQSLLVNFGQLKMFKDRKGNTLIFFEAE